MTGSSTSGPSFVVQSTTKSPRNSCPASSSRLSAVQRRAQLLRSVDHGAPAEHGGAGRGRLARLELAVGVDGDADPVGRQAELLAGDLLQDRVDALAHLGPGVEEGDRAVRLDAQHGAAVLGHAVADAGVLDAAGDPREAGARGRRP